MQVLLWFCEFPYGQCHWRWVDWLPSGTSSHIVSNDLLMYKGVLGQQARHCKLIWDHRDMSLASRIQSQTLTPERRTLRVITFLRDPVQSYLSRHFYAAYQAGMYSPMYGWDSSVLHDLKASIRRAIDKNLLTRFLAGCTGGLSVYSGPNIQMLRHAPLPYNSACSELKGQNNMDALWAQAKENLLQIYFVGITEQMDDCLDVLSMGMRNKSGAAKTNLTPPYLHLLSNGTLRDLKRLFQYDRMIYQLGLQRGHCQRKPAWE